MCKWGTDVEVTLCRPKSISGRMRISVDSCIAPLVQALNDAKIETTGCCCGHGKTHGWITLADGRALLIHETDGEIVTTEREAETAKGEL